MSKKIRIAGSSATSNITKQDLIKKNTACLLVAEKSAKYLPIKARSETLKEEEYLLKNLHEYRNYISHKIEACQYETDINEKIQLFFHINSLIPESQRLHVLSLLTDDYIDTMLYRIQGKIEQLCSNVDFSKLLKS